MIIVRTPFRVSFFGGGTDYPAWYNEHGGSVFATTIDKYCYLSCRYLPPFFEHKYRIVYSKIETVNHPNEFNHPAVKGVLNWMNWDKGIEIHHDGDLPARSGLGSSSSFTVSLINALNALQGKHVSKEQLAQNAIFVEQNIIGENVGSQDQVSAAFGGLNRIDFCQNGSIQVNPVVVSLERKTELQSHLMLFFTGFSRIASEIAQSQIENLKNREPEIKTMHAMVDESLQILSNPNTSILEFGKLLHQSWLFKRELSNKVSTPEIDLIYEKAMKEGATGGKILGAGGGGFLLLFVRPELQDHVKQALNHLIHVPFQFDDSGSRVVVYQPNGL